MKENVLKGLTAAAVAAVGTYFRQLTFPLALLLIVMTLDYATGMARAWLRGELSSKIGIRGIVKKVAYLCVVGVAVAVDWIMQIAAGELGLAFDGAYFCALLATVWLSLNECISILENVSAINEGAVPPFLMKLAAKLKQTAERKGGSVNDE